ncbi:YhcN/YlaJ family sporulation lipoprotein [Ammoniphilus sp. CFH 90114]|uniref:YhcN/YlaJ family sporulation lipoprotein n=1 Tax=Ammoniphilus sp. CFH 90114 TaxID=2493665 RepID=UPI00100F1247|nr:YhcN/YlaJ family sporulation lipoprotein [Ammoniphilus sp. CFH 90114]RXT07850.1 hypothetical protein EIZ39_10510 [Ammoniphilus sp. CFH 90114]
MKRSHFSLPLLLVLWVLSGCQAAEPNQPRVQSQETDAVYQQIGYNPVLSNHTASMVKKRINGVDDAVSVVIGEDVSIALKVTGIDRFRLKGIKKEVASQLKKDLSDRYTIHVTTDKKLFQDLQTLKRKVNHGEGTPKAIIKTYNKINKDMHG